MTALKFHPAVYQDIADAYNWYQLQLDGDQPVYLPVTQPDIDYFQRQLLKCLLLKLS